MSVTSKMENCKEEFNFVLLATHLGASILVLLVLMLVMHTYTVKIAATVEEALSNKSQVCCSEYKPPKLNAYQFPSFERFKLDIQQDEPGYVEMGRSKTFSHIDRPRLFMPPTIKKEPLTR